MAMYVRLCILIKRPTSLYPPYVLMFIYIVMANKLSEFQKSGLSEWLSEKLTVFADLPEWLTAALLAYITAAITNVTSNAATATLFLPIVGSLVSNWSSKINITILKIGLKASQ
jgi:sodium-dependent dicarboxylate transporter 2/3/5